MIFRGSRALGRLSQSTLPCLESRRIRLLQWSSERVPAFYSTGLLRQDANSKNGCSLIVPVIRRAYATERPVSRPKAHTGRTTTSPRKKAAPKAAATKKPAAPKKPTKSKPKPKARPKTKAKAKPKPKPRRRVLTDQQKAKRIATKENLDIKKLKELALAPPTQLPSTAWLVVIQQTVKDGDAGKGLDARKRLGGSAKAAAAKYKSLSPEELEHHNHIANENKAKNAVNYRKWLESHTPDQIRQANNARLNLRARKQLLKKWPLLKDERLVKRYKNAYIFFFTERVKSGDYRGMTLQQGSSLIGKEWKALSVEELKKYKDMAAQDMTRYEQERKAVYNLDVRHETPPSPSS